MVWCVTGFAVLALCACQIFFVVLACRMLLGLQWREGGIRFTVSLVFLPMKPHRGAQTMSADVLNFVNIQSVSFISEPSTLGAHQAVYKTLAAICRYGSFLCTVTKPVLNSCVFSPIQLGLCAEKWAFIVKCYFWSSLKIVANLVALKIDSFSYR